MGRHALLFVGVFAMSFVRCWRYGGLHRREEARGDFRGLVGRACGGRGRGADAWRRAPRWGRLGDVAVAGVWPVHPYRPSRRAIAAMCIRRLAEGSRDLATLSREELPRVTGGGDDAAHARAVKRSSEARGTLAATRWERSRMSRSAGSTCSCC